MIGLPEGAIPMAQAVTYCAQAPKSNASYLALRKAQAAVRETGTLPVPPHILNAPTRLMAEIGRGAGYQYPHDQEGGVARGVTYLPARLAGARYYEPTDRGYERYIRERLAEIRGGGT
jgi:putative ATPase